MKVSTILLYVAVIFVVAAVHTYLTFKKYGKEFDEEEAEKAAAKKAYYEKSIAAMEKARGQRAAYSKGQKQEEKESEKVDDMNLF